MITEEALKQYYQFERDFEATCKHICELLVRLSKKYDRDWDAFEMPDEDSWQGINCIYYVGDCDAYHEFFPTALLFMTDDEINEWIDKKLYEDLLEAERKKKIKEQEAQKKAEKTRKRDLAEYERIKAKYNLYEPKPFYELFCKDDRIDTPELIYNGPLTKEFVNEIWENDWTKEGCKYPVVKEGVVCRLASILKGQNMPKVKFKTKWWIDRLHEMYTEEECKILE